MADLRADIRQAVESVLITTPNVHHDVTEAVFAAAASHRAQLEKAADEVVALVEPLIDAVGDCCGCTSWGSAAHDAEVIMEAVARYRKEKTDAQA